MKKGKFYQVTMTSRQRGKMEWSRVECTWTDGVEATIAYPTVNPDNGKASRKVERILLKECVVQEIL